MQALHCGQTPNYLTNELFIRMPSSTYQFKTIYNSLVHGYTIPRDVTTQEDALLLLTALLSDTIYTQRCFLSLIFRSQKNTSKKLPPLHNPYAPLSADSEYSRVRHRLMAALDRWEQHFEQYVGDDIRALFHFTKIQLLCPHIFLLPKMAGYSATGNLCNPGMIEIPDKAIDLVWLVLDSCEKAFDSPRQKSAIWLPIVLFMSSLVLWNKISYQPEPGHKYGTLRALKTFRSEIVRLPWPCCAEMSTTLSRLTKI